MNTKKKPSSESIVREIKRKTRRKYSGEEKIRIVLEGLRGEQSITDLSRREGIHPGIYYKWSKAFLEAGKQRLNGDTVREAGSEEVGELRKENEDLKQLVAEIVLKNRKLKKTLRRVWNKDKPLYEVLPVRENGDYPHGRRVEPQCQMHSPTDRYQPQHVLPMV